MENKDQDSSLNFNIDVLTDGTNGSPSLSDLYGVQIFTKEVEKNSQTAINQRVKKSKQMQTQLFFSEDKSSKELGKIKENVFATTVLTKEKDYIEEKNSIPVSYWLTSSILVGLILIISILYAKKKSRERKKYIENIDDFL